jgi:hypothetical protein
VLTGPVVTQRLGDALLAAWAPATETGERGADRGERVLMRVVRVADDGSLTDVARDVPPSSHATMRSGDPTVSGSPTAFLGESQGPIWMAWTHYSIFGTATLYRVENGAWQSAPEHWAPLIGVQTPTGREASGDLVGTRSRGHLFKIENRVSGGGSWYRLPRLQSDSADAAADAVRRIKPLDAEEPYELADGSIVDVAKRVPEARGVRGADGRSARDFWVIDIDDTLYHVRGDVRDKVPFPDPTDKSAWHVQAEVDGALCLSGGPIAYCRRADGDPWRPIPLAAKDGWASVVAMRPHALFAVVVGDDRKSALIRFEIP